MHWRGNIERKSEHFDVRHLQRLPLGLNYVNQVSEVHRLLARPPLNEICEFVIDNTGVGRAVGDLFDESGTLPTKVTITAGSDQSAVGNRRWNVAKSSPDQCARCASTYRRIAVRGRTCRCWRVGGRIEGLQTKG